MIVLLLPRVDLGVQMHEPALVTQEGVAFLPFLHQVSA